LILPVVRRTKMMLLGRFTGVYIDLDPSSSEENQDDAIW